MWRENAIANSASVAEPLALRDARRAVRAQVRQLDELQQRLLRECHLKCVPRPRDGELAVGEMACLDRCVPKYLEVHELVGKEIDSVRKAFVAPPPAPTPPAPPAAPAGGR